MKDKRRRPDAKVKSSERDSNGDSQKLVVSGEDGAGVAESAASYAAGTGASAENATAAVEAAVPSTEPAVQSAETADSEEKVPGYDHLKLIAQGASGRVFAATSSKSGMVVAIKIYKKDLTPDADAVRRFEQEVDTLSKLRHPNIVKVLGFGTTASASPYIVMELADGVSIRTILDTDGVLEPRRTALIAREICRALAAAHELSIIHRDLKPNNIILDGESLTKVIDFGIAKAVGSSTDTITQYGAVIGTPAYMSPEQCLGQTVDGRSDIYSLGCTLFEMLTGSKAFDSATAVEAIAKQIAGDRSQIGKRLASTGAPVELQAIVRKCLAREPARRYKTVAELDHDLSSFLLGLPLTFTSAAPQANHANVAFSAVAIIVIAIGVNWWWSSAISHLNPISMSPIRLPRPLPSFPPSRNRDHFTNGVEIQNRFDRRVLFSDPTATTMGQALMDAAARKVSLAQADLQRIDVSQVQLNSLDLHDADLTSARIVDSTLSNVDLQGAILTRARLTRSTLQGVNLKDARMSSCDLSSVTAAAVNFTNADLTRANLMDAQLERALFHGANFSNAILRRANFDQADCSEAIFLGARFDAGQFKLANHNGAKFDVPF